jgi:prophage antirepressor-like protein
MGIELDVLIGHPEHDLLFIATQVARAAGLANPAGSVNLARKYHKCGRPLEGLMQDLCISLPVDEQGRKLRSTTVLFTEPETYKMLLRGNAPQSEPFRKWVTEIVLPSIRKTGKFDVNED